MSDEYFGFSTTQKRTLARLLGEADDTVAASVTALQTSVTNLNAWAADLATKLNADAGVTDVDYDTDPQA